MLLLTPPLTPNIILTLPLMRRRLRLVQVAQCSMLLNKVRPSAVVSAHLPNVLPVHTSDNLRVKHQSQVTCCFLSRQAVFFSSATVPGETFKCAKRFAVVWEEGPAEGLFDKVLGPPTPEIHNSTAPPSALGHPIEAGVFNAPNQEGAVD